MRKVSLILAVLLFTVPAWATVNINCVQQGTSNFVIVSYDSTTEAKKVRAFALDITVTNGTITDVNDNVNTWYDIYPGSIVIEGNTVVKDGNAVADPCDLPSDTKGGIGTSGITIEMGALYSPPDDANGPPKTGNLIRFTVTPVNPSANSNITIVENSSRGGVVLTDPNLDPSVVAPGCVIVRVQPDCLIGGNASANEKTDWVAWGKPNCWCYCRQCRGDADGKKTGPYWVTIPDLGVLSAGYNKNDTTLKTIPNGICADFDHKKTGPYRVTIPDLGILSSYYNKSAANVPNCNLAPVITGPYNFWCDPTSPQPCVPPGVVCP